MSVQIQFHIIDNFNNFHQTSPLYCHFWQSL